MCLSDTSHLKGFEEGLDGGRIKVVGVAVGNEQLVQGSKQLVLVG